MKLRFVGIFERGDERPNAAKLPQS